jgi:recombination protein RecR
LHFEIRLSMSAYPPTVVKLMEELTRLPGVGTRSAERIAFHLLKASTAEALGLAEAIRELKARIRHCSICKHLSDSDPCEFCSDPRRDRSVVCVVEQPKDVVSIEQTDAYRGLYHVLLGHISPLEGIGPEDLAVAELVERVKKDGIREVILATNPNLEGDGTALHITHQLRGLPVKITRPARGLAAGGSIEFAGKNTLADAINGRREVP